ncbi:hypothetical protein [Gracilibacillus orientalis]|uniref:hypothetical protein n=1 Tax=Gracilibacillus orientalis TaxID=334253 RepID=UPI000B87C9EF|nr:hypothetical protein [Gracilibacillus orientalis]
MEDGDFKFNEEIVQGKFSAWEISQVKRFLENTDPNVIKTIESEINGGDDFSTFSLPAIVLAFLATLAIFVGWK